MWPSDSRATVLCLHAILYPVPFDPVIGPQRLAADPWEKMGNLAPPLVRKLEAYFAAHGLDVPSDIDQTQQVADGYGAVRRLADGGEIEFRHFEGGLLAIYVRLTLLAAEELATLMRLCDFVIADGEVIESFGPTRVLALSQAAADAVPARVGKAEVVAPELLAGALYEWALGQIYRRADVDETGPTESASPDEAGGPEPDSLV